MADQLDHQTYVERQLAELHRDLAQTRAQQHEHDLVYERLRTQLERFVVAMDNVCTPADLEAIRATQIRVEDRQLQILALLRTIALRTLGIGIAASAVLAGLKHGNFLDGIISRFIT